jgi:hypothetical protein
MEDIEIRLDEAEVQFTADRVTEVMKELGHRCDADESMFLAQQLEFMKAREIVKLYPERRARKFIPISGDVPAGAEQYSYKIYDYRGAAKLIAEHATDLPLFDVTATKETGYIRTMGGAMVFTLDDLDRAALTGQDLSTEQQKAAVKGFEKGENDVLFFGSSKFKLKGFLNQHAANGGNVGLHSLPSDGTGASRLWTTKTVTQIIRDLDEMVESVIEQSKNTIVPTTILLPRSRWALLNNTPFSVAGGSEVTIKTWWERNHPGITLDWLYELETAGVGGIKRAICYRLDEEVLQGQVPLPYDQKPPQARGLSFLVPVRSRIGGVDIKHPLGILYFDGI